MSKVKSFFTEHGMGVGIGAAVVVVIAIIMFFYTTGIAKQSNYTLVYGTGTIGKANYRATEQSGAGRFYKGFFTTTYAYPATDRTYIVGEGKAGEADSDAAIEINAKDGNILVVTCSMSFRLKADKIREFHEKQGIKFAAWTDAGWSRMLEQIVRRPLMSDLQTEAKKYDAIQASSENMLDINNSVQDTLEADIARFAGGDYFQIVDFKINRISPKSQTIVDSLARRTAAVNDVETAKQKVLEAQQTALANETLAQSLNKPGSEAAVLQNLGNSGKVQFIYVPYGSAVAAQTK
ncbi:SPFH domain-containing protein [Candidatus Saccharibacteria bacterium]|nr:SPFH domain-containing protein [Candidatus Saccharibacteria bacterium]